MPDFNPDKERHTKHKFIVQKAWPKYDTSAGVETSKGTLKFGYEDSLVVKDEALAREIQQAHPRDLAVTRVRYPDHADRGHKYHFGQMPAMPWHKYDENGRRIQDDAQESEACQHQSDRE